MRRSRLPRKVQRKLAKVMHGIIIDRHAPQHAHTHTHITHGLFFLSVSNDLRNSNKKILKMVEEAKEKGNQIYEEALAQQQKLDALLEEAMNIKIQVKKARDQIKEGILGE